MRYVSLMLFLLVLVAPFALQRALTPKPPADVLVAMSVERLVIITPHNPDIRTVFGAAFNTWHQAHYSTGIELDFRVPGGTADVKRQLDTTYSPYRDKNGKLPPDVPADISVVWGGGDFSMDQEIKPLGILLPLRMTPAFLAEFRQAFPNPKLIGVKLYDDTALPDKTPTPQWIGVCLSSFGICYNPDVYRALQLPEPSPDHGWRDLTDPRLAGFVALADPAHAGSSAVAYQMVIQHAMAEAEAEVFKKNPKLKSMEKGDLKNNAEYQSAIAAGWKRGMSELVKIAANARYFTDSSTLVPMDVSRGEAAAGMAIDFYARVTEESVGPGRMQYFAPIGATAITPDPVAILYGTTDRKLVLSQHFIEFLLSPEGQRLWILKAGTPGGPAERSLRRMPIRPDVYTDRANWTDDVDPFAAAHGFNQRGEWMTLFGDSRPIWVAAWIDSRDALKEAYAVILSVPDNEKRAALIEKLADLPIEMADVARIRDERKALDTSKGELDEWRARQQIDWARKFRKHYQEVEDEARSRAGSAHRED